MIDTKMLVTILLAAVIIATVGFGIKYKLDLDAAHMRAADDALDSIYGKFEPQAPKYQ